tara:strand:- start:1003 stop:1107 length:105 start_codon:yes stop_codon:yes gene_type:complete
MFFDILFTILASLALVAFGIALIFLAYQDFKDEH